jgi:hypothetical protein
MGASRITRMETRATGARWSDGGSHRDEASPIGAFQALIRLDTRGGVHADASLHCSSRGDIGCLLSDYNGPHVARHGSRFVSRVPIRALHVTKRIRWKVLTTSQEGGHPDYAPDDRGRFA